MSDRIARELWGSRAANWLAVDSVGSAGGIILIWDTWKVQVMDSWRGSFSMVLIVKDVDQGHHWMISTVYGPVRHDEKEDFWNELNRRRARWNGAWCLGGDWNAVRFPSERLGSIGRMTDTLILVPPPCKKSALGISTIG